MGKQAYLPLDALCNFFCRMKSFASDCQRHAGEAGEIKDRDLLKLTTALHHDLSQIEVVQTEDPDSAEPDYKQLLTDANQRLKDKLNYLGMSWLKQLMQDQELAKKVAEEAEETFKPPTAFLSKSVITCKLINQVQKLDALTEALGPQPDLPAIADLMQWYVQVDCVEKDLVEFLGSDILPACQKFQKTIDGHLSSLCTSFSKRVEQLQALNAKYEPPGFKFLSTIFYSYRFDIFLTKLSYCSILYVYLSNIYFVLWHYITCIMYHVFLFKENDYRLHIVIWLQSPTAISYHIIYLLMRLYSYYIFIV